MDDLSVYSTHPVLQSCEEEPIHIWGTIQPHGFLLALTPDWRVSHVSENSEAYSGRAPNDWLGKPIDQLVTHEALHTLRNSLAGLRGHDAIGRSFSVELIPGVPTFDVAVHYANDKIAIEAEPGVTDDREAAALVRAMVGRLKHCTDMAAFLRDGARHTQALTGFDRVMIYRFDADANGEVVAEALRGSQEPYLGLRYPASDIPSQARSLYLRNSFRIIADVAAAPVRIQVDHAATDTLDQSLSVLRAVSPVHIQYLKNMGVAASLSISIIVDGKLWGLFACHHRTARLPSFAYRTAAELFGEMFSLMLEGRLRVEANAHDARAHALATLLIAEIAHDGHVLDDPRRLSDLIFDTIAADGLCLRVDSKISLYGLTPDAGQCDAIADTLAQGPMIDIFSTEALATFLPEAAGTTAGFMAIPLLQHHGDVLLLFRAEQTRTVLWAGNPDKAAGNAATGGMSPRKSFAAWTELVTGRCLPFSPAEKRAAETIRLSLLEAMARSMGRTAKPPASWGDGQDMIISELNHRVRNILALIRGLISQAQNGIETSDGFLSTLDERVQSLARAHDQITQDRWGPARLRDLVDTEADAYLGDMRDRVLASGPNILLQPSAFTTLALVFHELMTNAAKYGALSTNGGVLVDWRFDADGDLIIDWSERGGPTVAIPTRRGFGSTVIERIVPHDLGGTAEIEYAPAGVQAHFRVPSRHLAGLSTDTFTVPTLGRLEDDQLLAGLTVLLVEDNMIIALDCADTLRSLGALHVRTAASSGQAIALIKSETFQFALLDFNLGADTSVGIADTLVERGVPFAFATGYDARLRKNRHESIPVVGKPYGKKQLLPLLVRLGFGRTASGKENG